MGRRVERDNARRDETPGDPIIQSAIGALVAPLARLQRNPRSAFRAPQTAVERIKEDVRETVVRAFSRADAEAVLARVLDLVPDSERFLEKARVSIAEQRTELARDPTGKELLALHDEAHRNGPVAPSILLTRPNSEEDTVDLLSVLGKLCDAAHSRSERRARALLEAVPDLTEKLYASYARSVWGMTYLARGEWPSRPPAPFGALINQLDDVLHAPELIDPDVAHLRNAVQHRTAVYRTATREVSLHDRHPTRPERSWTKSFRLRDLELRLWRLLTAATTVTTQLRAIAQLEFVIETDLFSAISQFRDVLRGDPKATATLEAADFDARMLKSLVRSTPPMGVDLWFVETPVPRIAEHSLTALGGR